MGIDILKVSADYELSMVRDLFIEYVSFLGENLDFQGYKSEIENLPGIYSQPEGCILLALSSGKPAGCAALKRLSDRKNRACEMKRLYVRPEFRGMKLGKKLACCIINEAAEKGYETMYLDTLERLTSAMKMYSSLGFVQTDPYYFNPIEDAVYWKLDLSEYSENPFSFQ